MKKKCEGNLGKISKKMTGPKRDATKKTRDVTLKKNNILARQKWSVTLKKKHFGLR